MKSGHYCLLISVCIFFSLPVFSQKIVVTTLRAMTSLKNPSPDNIYQITDADKQGNWIYDDTDIASESNGGTILSSTNKKVSGRYKRIFQAEEGVNIDWFLNNSSTINDALQKALLVAEKINFSNKIYQIEPFSINPAALINPNRVVFYFNNSTIQTRSGTKCIKIIEIKDIPNLSLLGTLLLDGNASKTKISNPLQQNGEAFLQIVAPSNNVFSKLEIGTLSFQNMPICGITIDTHNNMSDMGYDRIVIKAFREINGFNQLNIQKDDFAIWGVNVRGAHRAVIIDSLYAQQDNEPWGDAPIEKPYYTFTFENQVDPSIHKRKDSLYVKNLYANYPCSIVFYTQAINHVLVDNYLIENALRKPNTNDAKAYPTMLQKNISWIGSKHTWTSYKSPNSSFQIKKLLIRNTNPAFMNESVINDITGLWLNKAITGAVIDEIETDVRLKFYGDGYYFGFTDVPDGGTNIGKFTSNIPAKLNYVQPLNADLTIEKLHLTKKSGVTFAMGNAKIGAITQEEGSQAVFESRENRFKNSLNRYDGFVVGSCQATNIIWRFNWSIAQQKLNDLNAITEGERYDFKNFSGNNYLQTNTTFSSSNDKSVYVTAYRYDADASLRNAVQQFLQFVEFNWSNVSMKLSDASTNNLTRRYVPVLSEKKESLTTNRKKLSLKGWRADWQPSKFEKCRIE